MRQTFRVLFASTVALSLCCVVASTLHAQSGNATPAMLDSIAAAPVLANRTIGLVAAVVKGNDTLLMKSYGKANVEWDVPMPVDAMFEVGSVAKQFTAAAILQLRDANKLTLEDDITKWLPNFDAAGRKITLRQLLNHTSGIFRFSEEPEWEMRMFVAGMPRDSAYRLVKLTPFQYPTGDAQAYSNSGFWLLGLVVEKASGMKYEDYLATRIFEPLGMTRSMYCNSNTNVARRAHGYGLQQGNTIFRAPMVSYAWVFAPGAICSTAGDLARWLAALHGGKVLSPSSYAEMITPAKLNDGTPLQYGLGIKVGEDMRGLRYIGHGGTAPGFRADAMWYPDAKLAVVVLMNTSAPGLSAGDTGGRLARAVLPWTRKEIAYYTGDATSLVGRYEVHMGGNQPQQVIEVTNTPEGVAFSPGGGRAQRLPWAGGLTFYPTDNTTLTFRKGSDGVMELHRDDAGNHAIMRRR